MLSSNQWHRPRSTDRSVTAFDANQSIAMRTKKKPPEGRLLYDYV
jgi:hypothetical protein